MFTGIIHRTATVSRVEQTPTGLRLALPAFSTDHVLGESIAVSGVCLTVAAIADGALAFDVIPETLDKTTLGSLKPGDVVHVERSLRAGDPIDGHFVQGHVDGVGTLVHQVANEHETRLRVEAPEPLIRYL